MDSRVRKKKAKKPWMWAVYGGLLAIVLIIGFAVYQGLGIIDGLGDFKKSEDDSRFSEFKDNPELKDPLKWEGTERVNILLLGGDARDADSNGIARTDSQMVVSIDPQTKTGHLLSVLRDAYVDIPGHKQDRVNTAITKGGPKLAMETIGNLTGLDIQYFVYADFEGFKALIDAIGGIEFEVEKNMKWIDNADGNRYDIDLQKGLQVLDGDKALQYVRFRNDAMSDYTRTERQRNFLKAVATEMQSAWNIIRMKEILESVEPYIETNMTVMDMLKLGQLGLGLHMAGSAQIPPMNLLVEKREGGAEVLGVRDNDKLLAYVQETLMHDDTLPALDETQAVNNGNGTQSNEAAQ